VNMVFALDDARAGNQPKGHAGPELNRHV
jgi:hypothetical protein